jgi:hypothetical protein
MKLVYISFLSGLLISALLAPVAVQAAAQKPPMESPQDRFYQDLLGAGGIGLLGSGALVSTLSDTYSEKLAGLAALGAGLYTLYTAVKMKSQEINQPLEAEAAKALKDAGNTIVTLTSLPRKPSLRLDLSMAFIDMIPVLTQARLLNESSYKAGKEKIRQFLELLLAHTTDRSKEAINEFLTRYQDAVIDIYQFLALYYGHINPITGKSINTKDTDAFIASNNLNPLHVALGALLLAKMDVDSKILEVDKYQKAFQSMAPLAIQLLRSNGPEHTAALDSIRTFIATFLLLNNDDPKVRLLEYLFQEYKNDAMFITLLYDYIAFEYASLNAAGKKISGKELADQQAKLVNLEYYELLFLHKQAKTIAMLIDKSDRSFASYRTLFKHMVPVALIAKQSEDGADILKTLLQKLFVHDKDPDIAQNVASYNADQILQVYGYIAVTYGGIEPLTGKDLSPDQAATLAKGYQSAIIPEHLFTKQQENVEPIEREEAESWAEEETPEEEEARESGYKAQYRPGEIEL